MRTVMRVPRAMKMDEYPSPGAVAFAEGCTRIAVA